MWRHGDVLIAPVATIPIEAKRQFTPILVHGELTGHSHRIKDPKSVEVWSTADTIFLRVIAKTATIVHEEHKPITFPQGMYRVWRQREYTPQAIRQILD